MDISTRPKRHHIKSICQIARRWAWLARVPFAQERVNCRLELIVNTALLKSPMTSKMPEFMFARCKPRICLVGALLTRGGEIALRHYHGSRPGMLVAV